MPAGSSRSVIVPHERTWFAGWRKRWRQRLNGWRHRHVPDGVYAVCVVWRIVKSPAFDLACRAVDQVSQGGAMMREKRAWSGLKEYSARHPAWTENAWRHVCAERRLSEAIAQADLAPLPTWRREHLVELAYLVHREHH